MDFDNRKVYGDTSITDGLVVFVVLLHLSSSEFIGDCPDAVSGLLSLFSSPGGNGRMGRYGHIRS